MRILHFADAHIDIAAHGRHDPVTGLPLRVLDFLRAMDTIIDAAIEERVDLVVFAGDAYKDRTPVPTFQREWGRRIKRLSAAGVETVLLVGNHDLSPAVGRANALQEFETLEVPHVHVVSKPSFLTPADLGGLPLQVIGLPWVSRSGMLAAMQNSPTPALPEADDNAPPVYEKLEEALTTLMHMWLEKASADLPVLLAAHASVQGALYGGERSVMLGSDLVLPRSLVCDPRLSYVALGHIHKAQDVNDGAQPPVIYPGSIERVDFGEVADEKYYVIAHVEHGKDTLVEWRKLNGRRFIDKYLQLKTEEDFQQRVMAAIPSEEELDGAIMRLILEYPRPLEALLDEGAVRRKAEKAFEFHLVRRPQMEARLRLSGDQAIASLSALELLQLYWQAAGTPPQDADELQKLAEEIIRQTPADIPEGRVG